MEKALIATAFLSVAAAASAQSSVTLYGRLDVGFDYMSGIPNNAYTASLSRVRLETGDWGTTKWGIKGAEDIGGGTRVLFNLEGKFLMNTGALGVSGSLFDRKTFVGFSNDKFGTVVMGRQIFIANGVYDIDPFGQTLWSSASLVRGRNWTHTSNAISYQSPKINGLDVYGQYSLSNSTNWNSNGNGQSTQGRQDGLQVTYTTPLFQLRGLYDEIRDPVTGKLDNVFSASREYTAGVNLYLGQFKIQGVYEASRTSGITNSAPGVPTTTDHEWAGVTWQPTPAASVIGAVYHINANNGGGDATLYSFGGAYALSKRTLVNFEVATTRNSKNANFGLNANSAGPGGTTSAGYNENPLYGHSQAGVFAGIDHSF